MKQNAAAVDENPLPIMVKLKEKLLVLFQDSSSRGILLVRERFSTKALINFIETDQELNEGKQ